MISGLWAGLADLVLPAECAGCRQARVPLRYGVCGGCVLALSGLSPRPVRPTPAPPGLPACFALGPYSGVLREALLSYKERGRYVLARPLGVLLAGVIAEAGGARRPVLLIPVPATARAARARHGDHLARLTRHAARRLRRYGWPVAVARPLWALPRADSTVLDSAGRAAAAKSAFRMRAGTSLRMARIGRDRTVVLLDDILTTGSTLTAVSAVLAARGVQPAAAAVIAATRRQQRK